MKSETDETAHGGSALVSRKQKCVMSPRKKLLIYQFNMKSWVRACFRIIFRFQGIAHFGHQTRFCVCTNLVVEMWAHKMCQSRNI